MRGEEADAAIRPRCSRRKRSATSRCPPKYKGADFQETDYWRLRGGLDVPKERFVSYPFCERDADGSPVVTCAGFDHLQQAQAVAHYYLERKEREGWSHERLLPLLAGVAGSLFQTVAGACLMAGILVFPAALGLAAFTVAASLMLLDFWNKVGPEREATMNAALCNVAIIGGLFIAAAISPI